MKLVKIDSLSNPQSFELGGTVLRVTDPCYDKDTWCAGTIENALLGMWHARVGYHIDQDDVERWRQWAIKEYEAEVALEEAFAKKCPDGAAWLDERKKQAALKREKKLAEIAESRGRVAYLHAWHKDAAFDKRIDDFSQYEKVDIHVGVDSGQAGFFDEAKYIGRPDHNETEYDAICELTLGKEQWGCRPYGAVSSSGYGDGGYDCYILRDKMGNMIAGIIVYMEEYEDEADEDVVEHEGAAEGV